MNFLYNMLGGYVVLVNLAAVGVYGWDEYCAIHHRWRISECSLLLLAGIGGSIGALLAMRLFHHKTQHKKFSIGVPIFLLVHITSIFYVLGIC